jgi:peptidoglycan/LPS O-acetylase OafA/YrhL
MVELVAKLAPSGSASPPVTKTRSLTLDAFRVILTILVTIFHGLSEMTFMLSTEETNGMLSHPIGRFIAIGFTAVDGFMVLTGLLTVGQLLRRYARAPRPTFRDVLDGYYGRIAHVFIPLGVWAVIYAVICRSGKYPDASVRSDAALQAMRMFAAMPGAAGAAPNGIDAEAAARGLPTSMRDNGLGMWPWMALGLGNMAPFGGLLQHTWSLAVQLQWYLLLPLAAWAYTSVRARLKMCSRGGSERVSEVARKTGPSVEALPPSERVYFTPAFVIKASVAGIALSAACRWVAYWKISLFDPVGIVGYGMDFAAYASTITRVGPLFYGAVLAALGSAEYGWLAQWFLARRAAVGRCHVLLRDVAVLALAATIPAVGVLNAYWRDTAHQYTMANPAPWPREVAYVLLRPGGVVSGLAYAWVLYSAQNGISWLPQSLFGAREIAASGDPSPVAAQSPVKLSPAANSVASVTPAPIQTPGDSNGKLSRWSRFVMAVAPITFSVYLTNSTVCEQLYGWPQRLHPCPSQLDIAAGNATQRLLLTTPSDSALFGDESAAELGASPHRLWHTLAAPFALQAAADDAPATDGEDAETSGLRRAWQASRLAERTAATAISTAIQALRGPESLYCVTDPSEDITRPGASGYNCHGLCYSNHRPLYGAAADNAPPQPPPGVGPIAPMMAWVQFCHYVVIVIFASAVVAWLFHVLVEVPLGTLLEMPSVRKLLFWPIVAYALVLLAISVPATALVNYNIMKNVTPELEASLMQQLQPAKP